MNIRLLAAAFAATLLATGASAGTASLTGTFAHDNDKALVRFTLDRAGVVTLKSLGYAGGTNAAGRAIARGGFDGVLSLYDSTGTVVEDASGNPIGFNDDGVGSMVDPTTGHGGDPILSLDLAAGGYSVYLTQYSNFGPINLANAFPFDGVPDFRSGFIDAYGSQRTGNWALDVSGASSVPEAASFVLLAVGTAGIVLRRRRTA